MTLQSFALRLARQTIDFLCKQDIENVTLEKTLVHSGVYEVGSCHAPESFARFLNHETVKRAFVLPHSKGCGRCQNAWIDARKIFGHLSFLIGWLDAPMMEGAGELGNQLSRRKVLKFQIAHEGAAA